MTGKTGKSGKTDFLQKSLAPATPMEDRREKRENTFRVFPFPISLFTSGTLFGILIKRLTIKKFEVVAVRKNVSLMIEVFRGKLRGIQVILVETLGAEWVETLSAR